MSIGVVSRSRSCPSHESLPSDFYRPQRTPETTFYQIVDSHYDEFERVYPRRYREDFGYWRPVIDDVVDKFLRCGDPEHGFARVRCPDCEHERFVAFSCKQRGFCPSCHQKRTLNFVNHLHDHVYEDVPHRQFVFTIPKRFRLYFRYNRDLLSDLARCAWRTIRDVYDFFLDGDKKPGAVASIQTFGSLMLWNPHIHMMVTDGGFDEDRWFHALPDVSTEPFLKVWEHHVFKMLIDQGRIKPDLAREMSEWEYTGFSVHKDVRIDAGDTEGLTRLSEYIARCPVAEAKITQDSIEDDILYNADHPNPLPFQDWRANPDSDTSKRNFEVFEPLDFLAQVTQHIPNKGQHLTRYYGWYSNVSRGKRAKADGESSTQQTFVEPAPESHQRWAALVKRVYEVDPLECPECGSEMTIIAFIRDPAVVHRILDHLDMLETSGNDPPRSPPDNDRRTERVYDHLPPGDELLPGS